MKNTRVLGVFTLTMINVAAIMSLRNLPIMADEGWGALFFYTVAGIGFFIPTSLVSAELATGWPSTGGVYTWVKEAFGPRWGFVAIWLQWVENVIWYPLVLSFTAGTIAYLIDPALAQNKIYTISVIFTTYWTCTFIDSLGMKASGLISSIGVIIGTVLPGALIISLGLLWVISGQPLQIPFSWKTTLPDLSNLQNISTIGGVMLGFAGMEMSAVHAKEVDNPQRDYPKAIFLSAVIILVLSILGSLSIAVVVPKGELSLVAGVMQAFSAFFNTYGIGWMTPIMAVLISAGAISMVSTWIVGPSKGLYQTAHEGHLPPIFHKKNKNGMPINILIIQGVTISLLCLAFLFLPSVNTSYWFLNDLTAQLYLVMYFLLFCAGIRLRYTQPNRPRHYRIPGGKTWGMWCVAGLGIVATLFTFRVGFIPPTRIEPESIWLFDLFLAGGVFFMTVLPLFIYALQKEHWKIK